MGSDKIMIVEKLITADFMVNMLLHIYIQIKVENLLMTYALSFQLVMISLKYDNSL